MRFFAAIKPRRMKSAPPCPARFAVFSACRLADLPAVQNAPADTRVFGADFRMQDGVRAEENRKIAAEFGREP